MNDNTKNQQFISIPFNLRSEDDRELYELIAKYIQAQNLNRSAWLKRTIRKSLESLKA